jgi:predicted HicB family RNase H-like nuclease
MSEKAKRLVLRLPATEHRGLKTIAAMQGKSIQQIILEALGLYYRKEAQQTNISNAN